MEIVSRDQVIINQELTTKEAVINAISEKAVALKISDHKDSLAEDFFGREALGSTGLGGGIAIPHAKSSFVNRVAVIIMKSEVPIEWESMDGSKVFIVIALLVPNENPDNIHLKILSAVSRKLVDKEFKNNILNAATEDEIFTLFNQVINESDPK